MDFLMVLLRIAHILFGVFWVGTVIFATIVLEPRLKALGPNIQNPVMGALMPLLTPLMLASSIITAVSGIILALILMGGTLSGFLAGGWGWAIFLGTIATAVTMVIGFGIITPTGRRMGSLGASIAGRPPSPEETQELQRMNDRIQTLTRINFVLLVFATLTMAVARFV